MLHFHVGFLFGKGNNKTGTYLESQKRGGNSISQIYEPESLFIMGDIFYFPFKKKSLYPFFHPVFSFLPEMLGNGGSSEGEKKPPKSYG